MVSESWVKEASLKEQAKEEKEKNRRPILLPIVRKKNMYGDSGSVF